MVNNTGVKTNFSSKRDAINGLAAAFGADVKNDRLTMAQKYDESTGTYYCHGKMYSKLIIEQSKQYMYSQAQKYAQMGAEYKDLSMAYDLSYEALCIITETAVTKKQ